jgi:hypothetical protein
MNQDWSDNEDDEELIQPNRDFPISDEEEEEDEYDMYELSQLTINKEISYEIKDRNNEEDNHKGVIKTVQIIEKKHLNINNDNNIIKKRQFNPVLPPPNKYNKKYNNIGFKLNSNDFPTL